MKRRDFTAAGLGVRRMRQRGATLIVGLIMIVLITLIVVNAFNLTSSNLKSVGNMQVRDEALAATNEAIEQVISSGFAIAPAASNFEIDIDKDGTNDYNVVVQVPTCTKAWVDASADPSDVELGPGMSSASTWNTEWDIDASATHAATGATVRIRQGTRVLLTEAQKNASCPS
jgi:Tfp pilus assembly protein PilX